MIKWGIIGLGNIAHQFVKDLLLVDNTTISAVASRSMDNAKAFAETYGIKKAYNQYTDVFADPEIDIVYIATPHDSHARYSILAMEAGKHVLCEKPLAVNAHQVQEIIDASRKNEVFMMEAFWSKFNPSISEVLKLIKEEKIGKINYVNADFTFLRNDAPDSRMLSMDCTGGSLLEMGVYPVFLAYSIFGNPEQVLATGRFHETGADMQTAAILRYEEGIAMLMSGFASQSDMIAKIYGTTGRIYLHPYWHETQGYTLIEGNNGIEKTTYKNLPTKGKGFTYEIEECLKCISNGQIESKHWSHLDSLNLITITDKIRRETGLKYPFE